MADPNKLFIRIIDAYEANNMLLYEQLLDEIIKKEYPIENYYNLTEIDYKDSRIKICFNYINAKTIFDYICNKEYYKSFIHLINYCDFDMMLDISEIEMLPNILDMYFLHTDANLYIYNYFSITSFVTYNHVAWRKIIQHCGIGVIQNQIEYESESDYKLLNLYFKYVDKIKNSNDLDMLAKISFRKNNINIFMISLLVSYDLMPKTFEIIYSLYKLKKKEPELFNKYIDLFDTDHEFEEITNQYFWDLTHNEHNTKFCEWFINTFPRAITPTSLRMTELVNAENYTGLRLIKKFGLKPTAADLRNAPHEIRKIFF